jgi:hypothetical protein
MLSKCSISSSSTLCFEFTIIDCNHVKWVHCHHGMARPRVADRGDDLQIWRVAANMRWRENGGSCTIRSFIICTHPQISLGKPSQGEWGGRGMWHAWERREKCTKFWWESPKERDHLEDQGVGGKMGTEWILGILAWGVWIGFDWLRTVTGGGLLWARWWTFGFLRHGVS